MVQIIVICYRTASRNLVHINFPQYSYLKTPEHEFISYSKTQILAPRATSFVNYRDLIVFLKLFNFIYLFQVSGKLFEHQIDVSIFIS